MASTSRRLARLFSCSASAPLCRGIGTPAIVASRSTASGKLRPSVSIRNAKTSPCLPDEKSWKNPFWSLTKKEGVFSALKGESPAHSRPCFFSLTRLPTTSETGSRARISSRNAGENFMRPRLARRAALASGALVCPRLPQPVSETPEGQEGRKTAKNLSPGKRLMFCAASSYGTRWRERPDSTGRGPGLEAARQLAWNSAPTHVFAEETPKDTPSRLQSVRGHLDRHTIHQIPLRIPGFAFHGRGAGRRNIHHELVADLLALGPWSDPGVDCAISARAGLDYHPGLPVAARPVPHQGRLGRGWSRPKNTRHP